MSNETNHSSDNRPSITPFRSSFWFSIILIGLFIAAVNFVNVMGHDEEGHGAVEPTMEATSGSTLEGESGLGKPAADTTQHMGSNAGVDTAHTEGH